ncbi:glycosyl transferase family 90-domain-containing protein [Crepidotus variabilis]|uniref:Glycosyl transferase family 90-domain-containing protein n=1 Tax=Crepidotus variabilis TaxID=179855 RepID=A0A9P6ECT0_9AGAR|nr:glycosyl transferase family 90-domain-containing protein [Crepidotus variabilis]
MLPRRRLVLVSSIIFSIYVLFTWFSPKDTFNSTKTQYASTRDVFVADADGFDIHEDAPTFTPPSPLSPAAESVPSPNYKAADPQATHTYLPNGLVETNPNGSHPVLELIQDAEARWQKKLNQASKTLEDAVTEYKRRYSRPPPAGFDDWWAYVQDNDVQLPDEYDFIYHDLEPFWGASPEDLIKIQKAQEEITDTYTLSKNETHPFVDLARTAFSTPDRWRERNLLRGMDEVLGLLEPIEHMLPNFRATFSPHDNPNLLSDFAVKQAYLNAAKEKKYVDLDNLPKVEHYGFASACPPGSPGRLTEGPVNQKIRPAPSISKTFIYDHELSMDPCYNPSIFYNHGQYVAHDLGPRPQPKLAMQFSWCTTPLFHDVQPPTFIAWIDDVKPRENDPPWEDKTDERLFWRGSNTGMNHNDGTRWIYAQRIHLVRMTSELNGTEKVIMPPFTTGQPNASTDMNWDKMQVGESVEIKKAFLNPSMMDISFSGKPLACDPKYCAYLETLFEWRNKVAPNGKNVGNHKYFVDIDGNGWSSRFKRLMTSNSLIFKATAYREWWIDRIQPWVHYVPIQVDYSDLYDSYLFFRGGAYGEGNHDELARKIASAGREWSLAFWRKEDMTAYFFRLLLEYARLLSPDRDAMSYQE